MSLFLKAVRESDLLIFSTNNNIVGKGVYQEVKTALKYKIPVFVLEKCNSKYSFYELKSIKIINEKDWTNYARTEILPDIL
ncbi:hypothetical protein LCGC14_2272270 [marine sediment metagenome]|uniref:Uncharacterized protein n=1 Tax=marine sediment metagenome TaxID=412755 RepID=A0A0F9CWX2_9ZZZZ